MTYVYSVIDRIDAVNFLLPRHYSGRTPSISYAFGVIDNETKSIVAACTFGMPASPFLAKGLAGEEYKNRVYELNRLCREEFYKEPLSKFVAWCLKQLKGKNIFIVSYSDTAMNHHGYIYQATNFIYTGCAKEHLDSFSNGKHARHYTQEDVNCPIKKKRFPKYRYVYICAENKRIKRKMLQALRFKVEPYPKGNNNANYQLGNFMKDTLVDKESGEITQSDNSVDLSNRTFAQQTYLFLGEF